ncbi:type II toxin-antitoxin system RelE/ParE family toxin [Treponema sp.]|uniref:type II toxin-antitoxin system RelE/ParE family toxin n=1 Tax=Treponema sp. TaxID=166 RepID=UPI00298E3A64|nr:type II toxin-antitoxin system RelE/ParE family toxin [Treponema sp.]MCR5613778.1 type II toxin-antitoxin system RelE/ParE family toxin [Treponema sp.]
MDFTVKITEQAEDDLADIYSYILTELKSSINADAVLGMLYTEINNLSFMADGYHLYPKEPWQSLGIHYFSIKNYSIFYIIKEVDGKFEARVTRVTNGRRDTDSLLNEMKENNF